ncbi:metallophosphoesterase [Thermus scotoductus]|uniref:Phosphohydrolase n=1 Tax=Thermus scotoductus TaxID=37636 RepID=A0A430RV97_THESC|nr:metallophosphoesterase [Thermus scotoductus]RTH23905.1 phosphohydrolase [Thermus scotoductus]RTH98297.1 phosphohydrolase [Thermus scotoductus]RTI41746.1 phosphohydrolase [Thermus scotoductus]
MRVFAIADPHLSRLHSKPMTIFGPNWQGHPEAFFRGWREVVAEGDLVIVPGDISWAMRLGEALPDLLDLAALPGKKVLLKGNHDYWWPSITRLRAVLPEGMYALQNDALVLDGVAVAGTRGWQYPPATPEDERIFAREVERLKLSLQDLEGRSYRHLIVAFHFPPFGPKGEATPLLELAAEAKPQAIVYGHLHGADPEKLPKEYRGIPLHLVAADALAFRPKLILEVG